jgi:hypothetical protein
MGDRTYIDRTSLCLSGHMFDHAGKCSPVDGGCGEGGGGDADGALLHHHPAPAQWLLAPEGGAEAAALISNRYVCMRDANFVQDCPATCTLKSLFYR